MKAADIVNQLKAILPTLTGLFSDTLSITSITSSGIIATATTASVHGLTLGDQVTISGALAPVAISDIVRTGASAQVVTLTPHDITFQNPNTEVTISGANESEFNGTFSLLSVPNRKNFLIKVADSGPISATGSPILIDPGSPFGYNGFKTILSVPTTTTFTYATDIQLPLPATGTPILNNGLRVTRAVDIDRALATYTGKTEPDLWLYVILHDVVNSKDRRTSDDSASANGAGGDRRQQIIQGATLLVVQEITGQLTAGEVRDDMEDIAAFLFKSLIGVKFSTGLAVEEGNGLLFLTHQTESYDGAVYAHGFDFQLLGSLNDIDTVDPDLNVAFREIALTIETGLGTGGKLIADIDLDDEPLGLSPRTTSEGAIRTTDDGNEREVVL